MTRNSSNPERKNPDFDFQSFLSALSGQGEPKPPFEEPQKAPSPGPPEPVIIRTHKTQKPQKYKAGISFRQEPPYQKKIISEKKHSAISPPKRPDEEAAIKITEDGEVAVTPNEQENKTALKETERVFMPFGQSMTTKKEQVPEKEKILLAGDVFDVKPKAPSGVRPHFIKRTEETPMNERITLSHISIRPQYTLEQLLETLLRENGTDLHLASGCIPSLRINSNIIPMELPELDEDHAVELLFSILSDEQKVTFEEEGNLDFSISYREKSRFRINYFRHHNGIGAVFHYIPTTILGIEMLGLPAVLKNLIKFKKGLILIAGPSGSGKSSTIASLLNEINHTRKLRIITIEKPIEYVFTSDLSLISQREIGSSALSFQEALWAVLREDPDVIMISELWDLDDIRQILKISETGHLVIASIHTTNCTKAVERLVDAFPADEQELARVMVSESLLGVIAQQLIPATDGRGRVLACEVLLSTSGLSTIIREGKLHQIPSVIQTGGKLGMQSMDQSLLRLVEEKAISPETAVIYANDERLFKSAGTDMNQ